MSAPFAGIVLAAGRSRRMGPANKLVLEVDGAPIVRRVVVCALDAALDPVLAVVGHDALEVREALADLPVQLVENRRPESGLSSSLRVGIDAVPDGAPGAVVLLGDMPWVRPEHVERLAAAFDPAAGHEICVATHDARRGNPVLWGRRLFDAMQGLSGDVGAKALMSLQAGFVHEVGMDDDAVLRDVDTPEEFDAMTAPGGA